MPLAEVSDVVLRHLRRLIPLSLFVVYMLDSDSDELVAAYASGSHASLISGLRIVRGHRLAGWVAANRQTIRNSDPVLDFGDSARAMSPRPHSALSTPLVAQDELIGVLSVYCTEKDAFDSDHERIIERVARQVADPLKRARDNSQSNAASLKVRSHGIPTSDSFLRDADASALTRPAALLLIKVNLFKQGAIELPEISVVINYVGELSSRALRPRDTLLRHDRDCLIAILPNTTHRSAEALRERLEMMFDPGAGNRNWRAQVRMAATPPDGPSVAELLKTAYERMAVVPSVYGRPEETGQVH
jgi:putative methionine-R-sulfoxide reductase with GAF domain